MPTLRSPPPRHRPEVRHACRSAPHPRRGHDDCRCAGRAPLERRRGRGLRERLHPRHGHPLQRRCPRGMLHQPGTPERAGRRRGSPRPERADRELERLLRGVRVSRAVGSIPGDRPDLPRLLPLRERRPQLRQLARARLPERRVALRGPRPHPHRRRRRSGDRLGQPRARVHGVGSLGRPGGHAEDVRRRVGGALREPGRRAGRYAQRRQTLPRHGGRRQRVLRTQSATARPSRTRRSR